MLSSEFALLALSLARPGSICPRLDLYYANECEGVNLWMGILGNVGCWVVVAGIERLRWPRYADEHWNPVLKQNGMSLILGICARWKVDDSPAFL